MRRHFQLLNLSDRCVRRILYRDLHFHPYKLEIVNELTVAHKALRVRCCQQMVHTHANLGGFLIMIDEKPISHKLFQIFQAIYENKCSLSHVFMCPPFVFF